MRYLDFAFISYILLVAGFSWLFILFRHWRLEQKDAVEKYNKTVCVDERRNFSVGIVFHCMEWLFFSGIILQSVNAYARWLRLSSSSYGEVFLDTIVWELRGVPVLICLYILCFHMTKRYLKQRKVMKKSRKNENTT